MFVKGNAFKALGNDQQKDRFEMWGTPMRVIADNVFGPEMRCLSEFKGFVFRNFLCHKNIFFFKSKCLKKRFTPFGGGGQLDEER